MPCPVLPGTWPQLMAGLHWAAHTWPVAIGPFFRKMPVSRHAMQTPNHQLLELTISSDSVPLSCYVSTLTRCAQRLKLTAPVLQLQLAPAADSAALPTALQDEPLAVRRLAALLAAVDASGVQEASLCLEQLRLQQLGGTEQGNTVELSRQEMPLLVSRQCYQAAPGMVVHCASLEGVSAVALGMLRRSAAPLSVR